MVGENVPVVVWVNVGVAVAGGGVRPEQTTILKLLRTIMWFQVPKVVRVGLKL